MQRVARWNEECTTPSMVRPPKQPVSRTLTVGEIAGRQPTATRITARYHSHMPMTGNDRWENGSNNDLLPVKKPVRRLSVTGDIGSNKHLFPVKKPVRRISVIGDIGSNFGKAYEENGFSCALISQPEVLYKRSPFAAGA